MASRCPRIRDRCRPITWRSMPHALPDGYWDRSDDLRPGIAAEVDLPADGRSPDEVAAHDSAHKGVAVFDHISNPANRAKARGRSRRGHWGVRSKIERLEISTSNQGANIVRHVPE